MDTKQKKCGILQTWFRKGFGFIYIDGQQSGTGKPERFYLHASKISSGNPAVGVRVRFDVDPIKEGELPAAINAEIVEEGGK